MIRRGYGRYLLSARLWLLLLPVVIVLGGVMLVRDSRAEVPIDQEEMNFLNLMNGYRAQNGLGPLTLENDLTEASDWMSIDMATDNYFPPDHIDNENPPRNPTQRVNHFGYVGQAGENILAGTLRFTGNSAFDAWRKSPPHNANMLNPNYTVIGVARAFNENSRYKWYWTTNFGLTTMPGPPPPFIPGLTQSPSPTPSPTPQGGTATPVPNNPIVNAQGCTAAALAFGDDSVSSPQTPVGFTMNLFGTSYDSLYVNNNGNVTFDGTLTTYTPFGLQGTSTKIIAPFFADVLTEGGNKGMVTYGQVTYEGKPAFCVHWKNVSYFVSSAKTDSGKRNNFQLILVQRSDTGVGNFDIIMNYDKVVWDVGDLSGGTGGLCDPQDCHPARMGYSNGSNVSFEYPGSNDSGKFLDSNSAGLSKNSRDSLQKGRYIFQVRNGAPPTGGTISGTVYGNSEAPANVLADASVELCGPTGCVKTNTNGAGEFLFTNNGEADYALRVFPPNTSALQPVETAPFHLPHDGAVTGKVIVLIPAVMPPPQTTISTRFTSGGVPVVFWAEPLALRTTGCTGGSGRYEIRKDGTAFRSGTMAEGPAGQYTATVPQLHPMHGQANVFIEVTCPGGPPQTQEFNIYIDPSGWVRTVEGDIIDGARVTLYRSESADGPFEIVPNGSAIMSPSNRTNPDITDGQGHFGWDVIAGFYKVRAERGGCSSPDNPQQKYVDTEVLVIPPPVTDLDIRLDCPLLHFDAGDVNCSGTVEGKDALQLFRYAVGLDTVQLPECPDIGGAVAGAGPPNTASIVGDLNCDGEVDVADAIAALRHISGARQPTTPQGCPAIG
jgi:hypothetical protein